MKSFAVTCCFLFSSIFMLPQAFVYGDTCPDKISSEIWVEKADSDQKVQDDFFALLKRCLQNHYSLQESVDDLSVNTLQNLEKLDSEHQKQFADFTLKALLFNAEVGFDSSQHNYAVLFNAEPGTLLFNLIPQDNATFVKWTQKAASQKEPRALFNLATRMAAQEPPEGFSRDISTAYIMLSYLKDKYSKVLPPSTMSYVSKTMTSISRQLGPAKTKKLKGAYKTFNFASLAKEN